MRLMKISAGGGHQYLIIRAWRLRAELELIEQRPIRAIIGCGAFRAACKLLKPSCCLAEWNRLGRMELWVSS